MAKLTPDDLLEALKVWNNLNLSKETFETFVGVHVISLTRHGYVADTFVADESYNRLQLLKSPHAYAMVKAWEAKGSNLVDDDDGKVD